MLRSTLVQKNTSVYSLAWGPKSANIVYTNGKNLVIQSIRANVLPISWNAHDGIILKVGWNPVNNLILSGGEDCKYKIWDSFARLLFASQMSDFPITSLAWSPDGQLFTIGSYNTIRLCDQVGWFHTIEKPTTGSILSLAWSADGTQVAAAGANGQVIFAKIVDQSMEWEGLEATVRDERLITTFNVDDGAVEKLEFRDRIVKMSVGYGHLIVITTLQCYIYSVKNFNTPSITELKDNNVLLILQAQDLFLLVDSGGFFLYNYEGRFISSLKMPSLKAEAIYPGIVALSGETMAVRDVADEKVVNLYEVAPAKPIGDGKPIVHSAEVLSLGLNQKGVAVDRRLVLLDKNKDLFLYQVRIYGRGRAVTKLCSMVSTFLWSETDNFLAAAQNDKLTVWYYPTLAFIDKELLPLTIQEIDILDECGKYACLHNFRGNHITLRRADGGLISFSISPYPACLNGYVSRNKWGDAVNLCRSAKDSLLWAYLAGLAVSAKNLELAELAYSAVNRPEKVDHIRQILEMPQSETRNAQVFLLAGQPRNAECVLLQSGLTFSAIMLNLTIYNWERALELAAKNDVAKSIVLTVRQQYLDNLRRQEFLKEFINCQATRFADSEALETAILEEYHKEAAVKA
uniref:Uncharacterized protein n=2 Tax=Schistocephalus solidus TaxID=70667 RepID=A0A0X3PK13_SCHSO